MCCRFVRKLLAVAFLPVIAIRPAFIAFENDRMTQRNPAIRSLLDYYRSCRHCATSCITSSDFPMTDETWSTVSDDETVTISFIRTSKTRIFCLQCPEKRRKHAYIYAKIRTGSDELNAKFCPNCLPECLINHQVNISDLTI